MTIHVPSAVHRNAGGALNAVSITRQTSVLNAAHQSRGCAPHAGLSMQVHAAETAVSQDIRKVNDDEA